MSTHATLTVPDKFRQTALALPEQIKKVLATVDNASDAGDMLNKADTMATYARRVRADREVIISAGMGCGSAKRSKRLAWLCCLVSSYCRRCQRHEHNGRAI